MYEITLPFVFSQIAGLCSVLFAAVSNFQKQKNRVLVLLILCNISCFIEYLFLGGLSGAYASILGIIRAYIFYLYSKNNKDKNKFIIIITMLTLLTLIPRIIIQYQLIDYSFPNIIIKNFNF